MRHRIPIVTALCSIIEIEIGLFFIWPVSLKFSKFFKFSSDYFYLHLEQFRYRYWYTFGLKWLQVSLCLASSLEIIAFIGIISHILLPKRKRLDLQFSYSFLLFADKSLFHFSFLEWPIYVRNRIWIIDTVLW